MRYSPTVGARPSGDRARVGLADTTWGWASRTGVHRRPRDWYTRCPGSRMTAKSGGRSRVGRVAAGAGKPRHRRTVGSRMRAGVPHGAAAHLGNTRLVLHRATARAARGTPVIAGG